MATQGAGGCVLGTEAGRMSAGLGPSCMQLGWADWILSGAGYSYGLRRRERNRHRGIDMLFRLVLELTPGKMVDRGKESATEDDRSLEALWANQVSINRQLKELSTDVLLLTIEMRCHCGQGMKMEIDIASASEVINAPTASPVIPTPALSSPPPVDGLTMTPKSIPAHAPLKPSAAPSPIIEASGPIVMQSLDAAGPSPQVAQGENSGGRQVETGIVLVVSLLMALAQ
ncbi:hypothetical protein IEQ34_011809 [Dendrobium chrysotoxum]|uniref:Uncharacterized protein n=1 Tax=Dendrobium chrysotoxum TaxID=161865 RepID=A0AAV7GRR8_DENCH|nr:hypothetical protein IEQ34_011809 [Dendrobium chrysotoxum]